MIGAHKQWSILTLLSLLLLKFNIGYFLLQTGYSVVSACVLTLRWKDRGDIHASKMRISSWCEGVTCLVIVAVSSFAAGLCYRFGAPFVSLLIFFLIAVAAAAALYFRQVSPFLFLKRQKDEKYCLVQFMCVLLPSSFSPLYKKIHSFGNLVAICKKNLEISFHPYFS